MAMSMGSDDGEPMVEMNTTPLIDVMLVLLIMFIITIPIQTHAVKIDLPQSAPPSDNVVDPVKNKVAIDAGGVISWNGAPIDLLTLQGTTRALLLDGESVPAGDYEWMRLKVNADPAVRDSFVTIGGQECEMRIPSGADAGATAAIQPGGSKGDPDVIAAANERGMAMCFTGHRHFWH